MQTQPHRDISEVVTKNLLKSLFVGENYMEETMEAIDQHETAVNMAFTPSVESSIHHWVYFQRFVLSYLNMHSKVAI